MKIELRNIKSEMEALRSDFSVLKGEIVHAK